MPLKRQYDRESVLERATIAFWSHGFETTSINDLVHETGLNRGSLYAAFDGKRGLFLECLAHYDGRLRLEFLDAVAQNRKPLDAMLTAFDKAARSAGETGLPPGCLLVNSALEVSPHDPQIKAFVNGALTGVKAFFARRIRAAQADGSISATLGPGQTAKVLLGLFLGLRAMVRTGLNEPAVGAVINQARSLLTEPT